MRARLHGRTGLVSPTVTSRMPARALIRILVADLVVPRHATAPAAGSSSRSDFLVQPRRVRGRQRDRPPAPRRLSGGVQTVLAAPWGLPPGRTSPARRIDTGLVGRAPGYPTSKTVIVPVVGDDRRFVRSFGANARRQRTSTSALVTAQVVRRRLPATSAKYETRLGAVPRTPGEGARRSCSTSSFRPTRSFRSTTCASCCLSSTTSSRTRTRPAL